VTQAIKMMASPEEVKMIFLDPLNATSRSFIVFAVNDNSMNAAGGSHWSLCVWSKPDNTFFHFDSSSGSNSSSCSKLVKILRSSLDCPSAGIENVQCLQQNNSYDCGIFVLCHTDIACQTAFKENSLKSVKKLQPKKVAVKRSEIIEIIQNLSSAD
jgi:sentrin-specific protease 8